MAGEISWVPTTLTVVQVTNQSTQLLAANPDARIRILVPVNGPRLWLGIGVDAVNGEGIPFSIRNPWREVAGSKSIPMYRGAINAVSSFGVSRTVRVLVLEGVATSPAP